MIIKILFLVQLFLVANAKLCDEGNSVDLSKEHALQDGTFVKNGVRFTTDYIYTKNVSGEVKSYGCLCEFQKCFRKCCPLGHVLLRDRNGTKSCIESYDVLQVGGLNVSYMDSFKRTVNLEDGEFTLIYGIPCNGDVFLERNLWAVQEDGRLYTEMKHSIPPWMIKSQDKYCVDTFVMEDEDGTQKTSFDALICFATTVEKQHYLVSATCMLISCVFILATVGVYGWLPELRNLHGKVLMTHLMCFFFAFAFLSTMQILLLIDNISPDCCLGLTIAIYFSLQSAFFWLNVMCFDIWWTFSGHRGMTIEKLSLRAKFCAYATYAFGIPTLLTIILVSLEFSGLPPHPFLPMIKRQGCFLYGKSKFFYLYGPIIVLWLANLMFFILTAVKITQIKKQTSVLKSRESATHDRQNSERQRLLLYVKLFLVMGINWLLEVVSALYPEAEIFWRVTDAYNVLIGLIIFIIFVCKRKIFRLMKKRYKQARGDSISKSNISTRTFCSTRDEIGLASRIDKNN